MIQKSNCLLSAALQGYKQFDVGEDRFAEVASFEGGVLQQEFLLMQY